MHKKVEEQTSHTFQPDIKSSLSVLRGEKAEQKPIHQRIASIQKEKQEQLVHLRTEIEINNPDLTFTPKLNENTRRIAEQKVVEADVTRRLMQDAYDKIYKKIKQATGVNQQLSDEYTFQPNISVHNRSVDQILQNNSLYKEVPDFVTRQEILAEKQKEHKLKLASEHMRPDQYTFSPKINNISEYLVQSHSERPNETLEQKVERLSKAVINLLK